MQREYGAYLGYAIAIIFLTACGGGGRDIVEPPPGGGDFALTVRAAEQDLSVAEKLGWTAGIPGAEVTVTPIDGGASRTFTTTSAGTASIPSLAAGKYRVSIRRLLNASEIATLNEVSGAGAFVGESELEVTDGSRTATVRVPASFRTSLVISEWSFEHKWIPGVGSYHFGGFLELYNNSDTTVYLDGVIVADAHHKVTHQPNLLAGVANCDLYKAYQNDPDGIWAEFIAAFPGSGRDYPLAPGKTTVVATDAIDHRTFFADELDLRGANFEFIGSADVDNPAVPNMVERGVREYFKGHGLHFDDGLAGVTPVVLPTDPASLVRANLPPNNTEFVRLPRERLLDVLTTISDWMANQQPPIPVCPELVHASMDRKYGVFQIDEPDAHLMSIHRKVLRTLPDGRHILQSTRTSANDFHRAPRSPGVVSP